MRQVTTLTRNSDGSLTIADAKGAAAASIPAPVLNDSSGNPDTSTSTIDAGYTVTGSAPTYTLTTTISPTWLTDPARKFPVHAGPDDDIRRLVA